MANIGFIGLGIMGTPMAAKLIAGGVKHGQLDLASDRRNWTQEMLEEFADAAFYAAFSRVQRARRTAPPAGGLAQLAAREAATVEPAITSDAYWQRHPIGSPERVQAVDEHRAAVVARAAMAANHAEEM